ncbi:hypothetical protein SO802_023321 [Lithocarpus litseifolius]|uniref:Kinesin motor domain-containing protein n=1 Tax=Lithocarpus litseifolius TaxID=425828 RepID=A0AAW2C839_9ROSI
MENSEARSSQRVRVAVSIRPLIMSERLLACTECISVVHGEPLPQVFKDKVFDLLDPNLPVKHAGPARDPIPIREVDGEITLAGVTEAEVRTKEEMAKHLSREAFVDGPSRSHAIFTITMEQKKVAHFVARVANEDIGDDILCAKLLLVHLAGSECAKQTGADGMHLKEGFSWRKQQNGYDCPANTNAKETLKNTLQHANRARNIQNKAVVLQRKTEKASTSAKSCTACREKDLEIIELKEKVGKLEMEKAELIWNASKKMRMAMDGDLSNEGHKNDLRNQGYRSSSRLEDMDTSESEMDDSDDDDWVPESEEEEKPVKKRICRTSVASNLLDTLDCCSCSKNSSCKTMRCPCRASGGSCGTSCACLSRKCANSRTVKGGSPEFLPPD